MSEAAQQPNVAMPARRNKARIFARSRWWHLAGEIASRLAHLLVLLAVITFLSFALMRIAGSDVIAAKMENTGVASAEVIAAQRHALGLDRPFLEQYFSWLINLISSGGVSFVTGKAVFPAFAAKLPATVVLMAAAVALTLITSIPLGMLAGFTQGKLPDRLVRVAAFLGNAMPGFFVAFLLAYFFGVQLGWLPVLSRSVSLRTVLLPAASLAIAMSAKYIRQIRTVVIEERGKPYVYAAYARGLSTWHVARMVLKSSLLHVVTLLGLSIGSLLGGTAIIESIFMWDGVGKMAVDAIAMRDYPVIQTYVMWMAIIYVCMAGLVDFLYSRIDPRVRI